MTHKALITALATVCSAIGFAPAAMSQASSQTTPSITIRSTVPNPNAVNRQPLTSDQLNTASTRLIDARRGFRPYSTVYGNGFGYGVGVDIPHSFKTQPNDTFGISRVSGRLFKYQAERTGVTEYRNPAKRQTASKIDMESLKLVLRTDTQREVSVFDASPRQGVTTHRNEHATPAPAETRRIIKKRNIGVADAGQDSNTVTVYRMPPMPQASGAVLIAPDGTVYTIGG